MPRAPRDLVILTGPEPSYRWRGFCAQVVELAEALGVQMVVTLGALLADVPHSRPVGVTAHASDPALVERLSLQTPTYEGPTGIVGVLQTACAAAGMPAASLWAAVPHYVAVAPNPKGALAILRRLESLVGVTVDASDLETAAVDYERQVTRAVELDPEVQAFVERLERAADDEEGPTDLSQLPSGDVLAREFQRFLRQRGGGHAGRLREYGRPRRARSLHGVRVLFATTRGAGHFGPLVPFAQRLRARRPRRAGRRPGVRGGARRRAPGCRSSPSARRRATSSTPPSRRSGARAAAVEHVVRDLFVGLHARAALRRHARGGRRSGGPT